MKKSLTKHLALALAVLMLATLFAGCGAEAQPAATPEATTDSQPSGPVQGGTITLRVAFDLGGYTWLSATNQLLTHYVQGRNFVWDGNEKVNILFESCEVSEDGTVWTVKLKDGIKWHDGESVTSEDYIFAREFWGQIPVTENGITDGSVYEATDELSFTVTLPAPNFEYDSSIVKPMPQHVWQDVLPEKRNDITDIKYSIGCGPFKLTEIVPNEYYVLERFEDYIGGAPYLDSIVFRVIPDAEAAMIALESGQVDGTIYDANQSTRVEQNSAYITYSAPSGTLQRLDFNTQLAKFSDKETRQAIAMLVNKEAIVNQVLRGEAVASYSCFPIADPYFDDSVVNKYEYDIDAAKELLAEAGWTEGADGILERDGERLSIELISPGVPEIEKAALIMQEDMKKAGIELTLKNVDFSQYFDALYGAEPNFELAYQGAGMPKGLTSNWKYIYAMPEANPGRYENPEVTALFEKAATKDEEIKREAYSEIQRLVSIDCPDIPLYEGNSLYATNQSVNFDEAKFDGSGIIVVYPEKIFVNQ